jgi:hypothetical protein
VRGRAAAVFGVVVVLTMLLATSATGQVVPPDDPVIQTGPADPTNSQNASFTFEDQGADVTFACRLDGTPEQFEPCDGTGTNTAHYTSVPEGQHLFEVKAVDSPVNESGVTSYTWTIDQTAPNTTINLGTAPDDPSNDPTPTFSFSSSEAGSSFTCELDSVGVPSCSSPQAFESVADGEHTFVVTATDAAGNVDPTPASYTWTIDLVPPPAPTITDNLGNLTDSASATVSFASEAGASFLCTLDGASSTCASPKTYTNLSDGLHTLDVIAKDPAGNESLPATRIWTVDLSPPHPAVTSPAAGSATADQTPQLLGTADAGPADDSTVTVELYAGSSPTGTPLGTFTPAVSAGGWSAVPQWLLAPGTYTVQVTQSDIFDRTGTSNPSTFKVDLAAPTVSLTRPRNGKLTASPTPTYRGLAGTADGDLPEITVEVHSGATASGPLVNTVQATAAGDGTWSAAQPTPLADGKYAVLAKQSDDAGSTGTSPVHVFTVDTTPPSALGSATLRSGYSAVAISWRRGADWKATDALAIYRRVGDGARRLKVMTTASSWTDRKVQNGVTYRYELVPTDKLGNQGSELSKNARPTGFRTPRNGATLTAPIGISWVDVPRSDYSNIQVWNAGLTRKMLSVWPRDNGYTLRSRWRYQGRDYRLRRGSTYRIYGWPGFGSVANANYGKSYGWVQFTVR